MSIDSSAIESLNQGTQNTQKPIELLPQLQSKERPLAKVLRIRKNLNIPSVTNWELEKEQRKGRVQEVLLHIKEQYGGDRNSQQIDVEKSYKELEERKTGIRIYGLEGAAQHTGALYAMKRNGIQNAEKTLALIERIYSNDLANRDERKVLFEKLKDPKILQTLSQVKDIPGIVKRLSMFGYDISSLENLTEWITDADKKLVVETLMGSDEKIIKKNCAVLRSHKHFYRGLFNKTAYGNTKETTQFIEELTEPLSEDTINSLDDFEIGKNYSDATVCTFVHPDELSTVHSFRDLARYKNIFDERLQLISAVLESMGILDGNPQKVNDILQNTPPHILRAIHVLSNEQRTDAMESFMSGYVQYDYRNFTETERVDILKKRQLELKNGEALEELQLIRDIYIMKGDINPSIEKIFQTREIPHMMDALASIGETFIDVNKGTAENNGAELFNINLLKGMIDSKAVTRLFQRQVETGVDVAFPQWWILASEKGYFKADTSLSSCLLGQQAYISEHLQEGHAKPEVWNVMSKSIQHDLREKSQNDLTPDTVPYLGIVFDADIGIKEYQELGRAYSKGLDQTSSHQVLQSRLIKSLLLRKDSLSAFFSQGQPTSEFIFSYLGEDEKYLEEMLDSEAISHVIETLPQEEKELYSAYKAFGKNNKQLGPLVKNLIKEGEGNNEKRRLLIEGAKLIKDLPFKIRWDTGESVLTEITPALENDGPMDQSQLVRAERALHLFELSTNTRSKELKRMMPSLKPLLMESKDIDETFRSIEQTLLHNNLPQVVKNFSVVQSIFSQQEKGISRIEALFAEEKSEVILSPALTERTDAERFDLINRRMLRNAIQSGDQNLKAYLETYKHAHSILGYVQKYGLEDTTAFHRQLILFLNKAEALARYEKYDEITIYKAKTGVGNSAKELQIRLDILAQSMGVESYTEIPKRLLETLLQPLGYESMDQALNDLEKFKQEADARNRKFAEGIGGGAPIFAESDLLKSTQSKVMRGIIRSGPQCAEALGEDAESNNTQFDADFSRVGATDVGLSFEQVLQRSLTRTSMSSSNDVLLLVKNRGNFIDTSNGTQYKVDEPSYETFWSKYADKHYGVAGDVERRHYGVTIGVASTDISAIILTDSFMQAADFQQRMNQLHFNIVAGGMYIPVLYQGKIIYTPEQFDSEHIEGAVISKTIENINKNGAPASDILDVLLQNPLLSYLYKQSAHIQEGYTVGDHTKMVLQQYEKYVRKNLVALNINQAEFALMLALHDVGKSLSDDTRQQHHYTRPIIEDVLNNVAMSQMTKDLIVDVASQDILGEYITGEIQLSQAQKEMQYIAEKNGIPIIDVFQICRSYFMSDVSAYTKDADMQGIGRFDKNIHFNKEKGLMELDSQWKEKLDVLRENAFLQYLQEVANE